MVIIKKKYGARIKIFVILAILGVLVKLGRSGSHEDGLNP